MSSKNWPKQLYMAAGWRLIKSTSRLQRSTSHKANEVSRPWTRIHVSVHSQNSHLPREGSHSRFPTTEITVFFSFSPISGMRCSISFFGKYFISFPVRSSVCGSISTWTYASHVPVSTQGKPVSPPRQKVDNLQICWKLDQVYCAWLTKWVLKREIIQLAELCLSKWWIKSGTWYYWISIWRYWLVLGQYKLELLGFRWYRVSKGLVYIGKSRDLVGCYRCLTDRPTQTTEYSATQLSLQYKT